MITAIPRAHALYIAPLKHMHETTTLPRIEPSSSTGAVIRGHLSEKGRLEAVPPEKLRPEARERLDKSRAEIRGLENEILGYGLKP